MSSKIITVRSRQTVYDICIQEYGTLDLLILLIKQNNLFRNNTLVAGDTLTIEEGVGNEEVKALFKTDIAQNNFVDTEFFTADTTSFTADSTLFTADKTIV